MNQINTILPYRSMGGWAFDDNAVGLEREPFVAGADIAIDKIVEYLGIKTDKIKMTFSKDKFPGHHIKLEYSTMNVLGEGDFYSIDKTNQFTEIDSDAGHWEGETFFLWLCPALLEYFDEAPDEIYVKIEEYNK